MRERLVDVWSSDELDCLRKGGVGQICTIKSKPANYPIIVIFPLRPFQSYFKVIGY
jgi:hypothetical protein